MSEAAKKDEPRVLPYVMAINEGVREVLKEQQDAFVAGEDVAGAGGVYGYYTGLLAEFGPERVYDTPISEKGIIGLGVGASATGCRPVIDLMFMDFIGECMDEIANQMAKMRFMFGGGATLPVTVLTMAGAGQNLAAQHSQSLEAWLAHLPGVKVICPSDAYDAKGMTIAAARDDNPVFVVFNKASLAMSMEVPEGAYEVEIGKAAIRREGKDLTIIGVSRMVHEAMKAADKLQADYGLDVEVIEYFSLLGFGLVGVGGLRVEFAFPEFDFSIFLLNQFDEVFVFVDKMSVLGKQKFNFFLQIIYFLALPDLEKKFLVDSNQL